MDELAGWKAAFNLSDTFGGLESTRAFARRTDAGFYQHYARSDSGRVGMDVGCSYDCLFLPHLPESEVWGWDESHGDAHDLEEIPDGALDFVYSSHLFEHMEDPERALRSQARVVKPSGHIILVLPHRDYYERRTELPSRYNDDHKRFYLPFEQDPPVTVSVFGFVSETLSDIGRDWRWIDLSTELDGTTNWRSPQLHANGLFNIVATVRLGEPHG